MRNNTTAVPRPILGADFFAKAGLLTSAANVWRVLRVVAVPPWLWCLPRAIQLQSSAVCTPRTLPAGTSFWTISRPSWYLLSTCKGHRRTASSMSFPQKAPQLLLALDNLLATRRAKKSSRKCWTWGLSASQVLFGRALYMLWPNLAGVGGPVTTTDTSTLSQDTICTRCLIYTLSPRWLPAQLCFPWWT